MILSPLHHLGLPKVQIPALEAVYQATITAFFDAVQTAKSGEYGGDLKVIRTPGAVVVRAPTYSAFFRVENIYHATSGHHVWTRFDADADSPVSGGYFFFHVTRRPSDPSWEGSAHLNFLHPCLFDLVTLGHPALEMKK